MLLLFKGSLSHPQNFNVIAHSHQRHFKRRLGFGTYIFSGGHFRAGGLDGLQPFADFFLNVWLLHLEEPAAVAVDFEGRIAAGHGRAQHLEILFTGEAAVGQHDEALGLGLGVFQIETAVVFLNRRALQRRQAVDEILQIRRHVPGVNRRAEADDVRRVVKLEQIGHIVALDAEPRRLEPAGEAASAVADMAVAQINRLGLGAGGRGALQKCVSYDLGRAVRPGRAAVKYSNFHIFLLFVLIRFSNSFYIFCEKSP